MAWTIVFLPTWRLFGNRGMLHGVVFGFWKILPVFVSWKLPVLNARLLTTIQLRDYAEREIIFIEQAVPLHTFHENNPHTLIQQFFLSIKRIDSIWKKWKLQDSNLWLVGYEPTALPTELSFLSRGLLQFKNGSLLLRFFPSQPQQRDWDCWFLRSAESIRGIWSPFNHPRWDRWNQFGGELYHG